MKTSWLRNIIILLATAVIIPIRAAEKASKVLSAMDGDTITLSYSNDGKTYYFLAASRKTVEAVEEVNTNAALWKVKATNSDFRLQNIGANKNNAWLQVDSDGKLQIGNEKKSTVWYLNNVKDTSNYLGIGRGFASVYYGAENKNYLFYDKLTNTWIAKNGEKNPLRIERWSQHDSAWIAIDLNHDIINFPFQREGFYMGGEQSMTLTYNAKKKTESYLYNVPEKKEGRIPSKIAPQSSVTEIRQRPTIYWASSPKRTTSVLLDGLVSNDGEIYIETIGREMMKISTPTSSDGGKTWSITVETIGESPINLKRDGKYVDFVDNIVATVTDGTLTATHRQAVTRRAGHYLSEDSLYVQLTPSTYLFDKTEKTIPFTTTIELITGGKWLGIDKQVLKNGGYTFSNTVTQPLKMGNLSQQYAYRNENGTQADWIEAATSSNGHFTAKVKANAAAQPRHATLLTTYTYSTPSKTYRTAVATAVMQLGTDPGTYVAFHHKPGRGNSALNEKGYQPVHTVEKTIYYKPSEDIPLNLNENAYIGYYRWYDYDTDKDPAFKQDGTYDNNFWNLKPKVGTTPFREINQGDFDHSRGLYVTYSELKSGKPQSPKIHTASLNGEVRNIACDISAYTDATITDDAITEPTLSYRQIFHLRPAKEVADSLTYCTENYYEVHHYIAPTNTDVLLSTDYVHYSGDNVDKCYFYWKPNTSGDMYRVGNHGTPAWYIDNVSQTFSSMTYVGDYLKVSSDKPDTVVYDLRWPTSASGLSKELLVVRFIVYFVDKATYGPSTTELVSDAEIAKNYISLVKEDFNYEKPGTTDIRYYDGHLPWEEATYGYTYPANNTPSYQRAAQKAFPYYGEYTILNRVNESWAKAEQHGGAANGYCLYADGTITPGLVASVASDAKICSGQQMYFSAWVCNPCPTNVGGDLPIFRFNVQGRNQGGEWTNVGQFFTGPLPKGAAWHQIMFPIVSEENYDETRVSIYNFSPDNNGNDFLVDDIHLFATQLPLQAYQAATTCAEDSNEVIITRIDYTRLTGDWAGDTIYYQVYNTTADSGLWAKYYRYKQMDVQDYPECPYGYIRVPCNDYDPTKTNDPNYLAKHEFITEDETSLVYESIAAFKDSLLARKDNDGRVRAQKAYVKTVEQGEERYVMYVGEVITKDQLKASNQYEVRMANTVVDLKHPDCALRTELPFSNLTDFFFNGSVAPEEGVCANNIYPINVVVTNQYVDKNDQVQTIRANALADWLVADKTDDCYLADSLKTPENIASADAAFLAKYGYPRGDVRDAMAAIRRVSDDNPNYAVSDAQLLKPTTWLSQEWVVMLQDLQNKGYLQLRKETEWCYMLSGDTLRYWIFPITGTAKAEIDGKMKQLDDCASPSYMRVFAGQNDFVLSLSPIKPEDMTESQKGQIPGARISATEARNQFWTVVSECSDKVERLVEDSCILTTTNDPLVLDAMNKQGFRMRFSNVLDKAAKTLTLAPLADNTIAMRPGYEYTLRVKLIGNNGSGGTLSDPCAVGYSFFKVIVLPDTMLWAPTVSNEWGDDRNWRGIVNADTIAYGYAPLAGLTNVIIPTMADPKDYPCISLTNRYPMDAHYTPNGCKDIQFRKNAILINQHLLDYKRAFVDMVLASAKWYSMAAPLQNMYSGDLFIPHSGKYTDPGCQSVESTRDFEVAPFQGTRLSDAAYAFAAAYYNKTVKLWHTESIYTDQLSANTAAFVRSNAMNELLAPGTGVQVRGYGPGADGEELIVRLPKQDTQYYYYDKITGSISSKSDAISNRANGYLLAFEPTDSDTTMTITLTNKQESTLFLFGNPTMAYIDMERFCKDNSSVIQPAFQKMEGNAWVTVTSATTTDFSQRLVAPMQSVLLTATNQSTSLTLRLKPAHLTGQVQTTATLASSAKPARAAAPAMETGWGNTIPPVMDIVLYTPLAEEDDQAYATAFAAVATNAAASDDYLPSEDVLFISSGIETADNVVVSPLNLYTLSGEQTLMADIRREISIIPIGMVVSNEIREDYDSLYLSFRLSSAWSDECYLCDNLTHTRVPIWNDTRVKVPVPAANHELRYYIEGPAYIPAGPDTPTDNENYGNNENNGIYATNAKVQVYTSAPQTATVVANTPIQQVRVFDITGRPLLTQTLSGCADELPRPACGEGAGGGEMSGCAGVPACSNGGAVSMPHQEENQPATNNPTPVLTLTVPSGIAIVETTLFNGTTTRTKLLVP